MAAVRVIPAVEARVHLGEIMKRSFKKGERFIVEKAGIPMIVILSVEEYSRLIRDREEEFKIFDKIRSNIPDIPAEEMEKDVNKAIQAIRGNRA